MTSVPVRVPGGVLEGDFVAGSSPNSHCALLLHPRSRYGGHMDLPVMRTLFQACVEAGFYTLRINHRGVGKSVALCGGADDGIDDLNDASHAIDWLKSQVDVWNPPVMVVGYSHGAWSGLQLTMRRPEISRFIAISPLVMAMDFSFLSPCPVPGLVVHGSSDEVTQNDAVEMFVSHVNSNSRGKVECKFIPNAGHLYEGKSLELLSEVVNQYILDNTASGVASKIASKHKGKKSSSNKLLPANV